MLSFDVDGMRFNFRVAAVIAEGGRVLLAQVEGDDFWVLPGGRAEAGENSVTTLRRELAEELGVDARVERLLWVAESFFRLAGRHFHELGFYYRVTVPGGPEGLLPEPGQTTRRQEGDQVLLFRWFPVDGLEGVPLYPAFLRRGLRSLPATVTHVIDVDARRETARD